MEKLIRSGHTTFELKVPYELFETGKTGIEKPLIVYLHGFNQNIKLFKKLVKDLLTVEAYHLFLEAPYPIYDRRGKKKVKDWGRSWYLYDGKQEQFVRSLERSSEFIQKVLDNIADDISVSKIALLGYSMGGYQAGYYALSRQKQITDLIVIGSRIKTEIFEENSQNYDYLNVLALHGAQDKSVKSRPQKQSCEQLSGWGADVTFKELKGTHALSSFFVKKTRQWLLKKGYQSL